MSDSSTITVHLPHETTTKLERLAGHTRRTSGALAGDAVAAYVDRELAVIDAIERGRAEIRAGLGLSTDEVFGEVETVICKEAERIAR
ncbi:CopG family ribbon-helix-helix protein [Methylobacterium haplocladii]|uniref:CopG family transcriptional regulator n=1 Tax=Methylobacterium haplocladii TaxID=1176176 RepID=A0A512IR48_9HYPH|nr:CopG family transcriptional regulator [Methylobacterium haplocladii]GEP00153.1 CopG family transcriptional regulator [Methylobacterium haplocladii]GJD82183.1 hypothetical protein HPGCJGGD_0031 [Methylobacterium haplocladii]GLS60774.1 CopG family transcriptional regulator [Methylobacterium haplocladii]